MPHPLAPFNPIPTRGGSRAFTLVEILVVVGIVGVLVGLILPVIGVARGAAGQAACAANLRQWAIAVNLYAERNDDWLPRRGQGKSPTSALQWNDDWFNALPPYLSQPTYQQLVTVGKIPQVGDRSIWICPQLTGAPNSYGNVFGYGMNMALSPRIAPVPDKLSGVGSPSTLVFMADSPAGYGSTVPFVSTANAPAQFNPAARHHGKVNVALLDGHVVAFDGNYLGCGVAGDPVHPDACNRPDARWYWYVPGPSAPWGGP